MSETSAQSIPVEVYAESTPNPNSLKFVVNRALLPGKTLEFTAVSQTAESPLARELFRFSFVRSVFITQNFISVIKTDQPEWIEVQGMVREFIKSWMADNKAVIVELQGESRKGTPITAPGIVPENLSETEKQIVQVLDEYIRPAVEGDGGSITFKQFVDGTVYVILQGSCSGCPSSTLTLKAGIEGLLRRMVPGVERVVAENG